MNSVKCMKKLRGITSIVLVLFMLFGIFPAKLFAYSEENISKEITYGEETKTVLFSVSDVYGKAGDTVKVTVDVYNNLGISNAKLTIGYDNNLKLAEIEKGNAFEILDFTPPGKNANEAYYNSPVTFLWDSLEDGSENDGNILVLTFFISEDAIAGDKYEINIFCDDGDVANSSLEPLDVVLENGYVEILDYTPGDVNGDGRINGTDITLLRRYITGGYGTVIVTDAADVNSDGRLNGTDVTLIRRYVTGGYGVQLKPALHICEHNLQKIDGKDPTCTEDGNSEYWFCSFCGKYFADEFGKNEISEESTVLHSTGHTIVIDEAVAPTYETTGLTEGSHCGICNKIIVEQQVVEKLDAKYHSVTYRNSTEKFSLPEISLDFTKYAEHAGLLDMPVPVVQGYNFIGWFTAPIGGQLVAHIPAGSTQDYVLYARWETITYTITYEDAPVNNNPSTYTVEDEFALTDAEWSGLSFKEWTCDGKVISKIFKGTVGNITIKANWISEKNMAVPNKGQNTNVVVFDEEAERYYFVYELGTIENIVLAELGTDDKNSGEEVKWIISETVSIEDSIADEIAHTISDSISQTSEWSESKNWALLESSSINGSITSALESEGIGKIEASLGFTESSEESQSKGYGESNATSGETQISDAVSATVAYTKGISKTITKEITISGDMPKGKYSYVYAGSVRVFAVVIYDPAEQNYYLDTYSVLDSNMYEKRLYEAPSDSTANISSSEGLAFNIPTAEIAEYVDSVYYIQFDANGGKGDMATSVYKVGEKQNLPTNMYKRDGFIFVGWGVDPDGGAIYPDNSEIQDVASRDEIINLYAIWEPIPYTAEWKEEVGFTISVRRTSSPNGGASIGVLKSGSTVYYGDVLEISYTSSTGYTITTNGYTSVTVTGNITESMIFAQARLNTYTVNYNANGGTGTTFSSTHTYNQTKALSSNGFTRKGWVFMGWSKNKNATVPTYTDKQSVSNLTSEDGGNVTLYAVWNLVIGHEYSFKTFEVNNSVNGANGYYVSLSDTFDMNEIKDRGYKIQISLNFVLKDIDAGSDEKYKISITVFNGTSDLYPKLYESGTLTISAGSINKNMSNIVNKYSNELSSDQVGFLFTEDTWSAFGVVTNSYYVQNLKMNILFS